MPDVSMREVAALAGVSLTTVSNALNRPELVSSSTAARITRAIEELGYVPNTAARQLRAGRSSALGMAVMNITNPFFADLVLGAEEAALRAGYSVIVGNSYDSTVRQGHYLELFDRQRLDGVLIAPVRGSLEMLERFRTRKVPVVLMDRVDETGRYPSVSLDDVRGGMLAARHLVDGGSRHLAFIGGPLDVPQMRDRWKGWETIASAAGVRTTVIETDNLSPSLGRELGERLLTMDARDRPDGVFAANDVLALGLLQSVIAGGISVPEALSIIGYDDIEFASAAIVPLTSIRQPAKQMGVRGAELLLSRIEGTAAPSSARFQPVLVPRGSTRGGRRAE